jgi:hypothetical protein
VPSRCSKFQPLSQFDAAKRSCATSLARHNNARRKQEADKPKSKSKSPGTSSPHAGGTDDTASVMHGWHVGDDDVALPLPRLGGVGSPSLAAFFDGGVQDMAEWLCGTDAFPEVLAPATAADAPGSPAPARTPAAASAAAQAAAVTSHTLHLKLGNAHDVTQVPMGSLLPELETLLQGLHPLAAASRYGCLLLSFDVLTPATTSGASTAEVVADAVATVLRAQKAQALVPDSSVLLFTRDVADAALGAPLLATDADTAVAAAAGCPPAGVPPLTAGWQDGRVPPPLQGLGPGAALLQRRADGSATVTLELGCPLGAVSDGCREVTTSVHARAQGQTLATELVTAMQLVVTLPADVACQGCVALLLEAQEVTRVQGERQESTRLSRPLAVLGCHDADVAAQVSSTCASLAQAGDVLRERESMDDVLRVCGAAFHPTAPLAVCVAAAHACLVLGWNAVLEQLLQAQHLSSVSRGALVLASAGHMRTGRPVGSPACTSVFKAAALQLWPDAAPAAAARLLLECEQEGNSVAELAIDAAMLAASAQADDGGAAQVLQSMQLLHLQTQPAPVHAGAPRGTGVVSATDEATQDAASDDARFATFLTVQNHNWWAMVGVLTPLAGLASLKCAWMDILSQAAVPVADRLDSLSSVKLDLLRQTRLHPFRTGATADVLQVPWSRVLSVARADMALLLCLRIPADLAIGYLVARYLSTHSRRQKLMANPGLGEWLNHTLRKLTVITGTFYTLQDALIAWGTRGAAVEWPASVCAFYAFGVVTTFQAALFPVPYNALSWLSCFLAYFSALPLVPRFHVIVLQNYGYALLVLALLFAALQARGREAAMRRLWRKQEAAVQGGGKQKQA